MKQGFIAFLCLFVNLNVLTAQAKIHSKTTYFNGHTQRGGVEMYTYLPQKTIITTWEYYTNGQPTEPINHTLQYDDSGQKTSETVVYYNDWIGNGKGVWTQNQALYQYDEKKCLVGQTFTQAQLGKTPYSIETHVFRNNHKCRVEAETITTTYPLNPTWKAPAPTIKTFQYDANDSLLTLSYRVKDSLTDYGYLKFERLPNGKPLTLINSNAFDNSSSYTSLKKLVYTYDSLGRCATIFEYYNDRTPNSAYILHNTIENAYNTEGFLSRQIQKFVVSNNPCAGTETLFTYNCDKSYKEIIVKPINGKIICSESFKKRYVYTYTDVQSCDPLESGDFKIFPNPAHSVFSIQSPSLKSGNWQMILVDALGKVQMQQKLNAASEIFDFWLTDLPSGLYYVRLTNGQERMVKKLFIAN